MIIVEIQTNAEGTPAVLEPIVQTDRNLAEQVYHQKLSYAAASQVAAHTVIMFNAYGEQVKKETYYHE